MKTDTHNKFSATTIILHWVVGITMILLLAVGVYMVETTTRSLFPWHKSFGVLIFLIIIARVVWRIKNGWPRAVGEYSHIEHLMAKIVHWALIIGTVLMPLSGFLNSSLGGYGVKLFGLELVARNPDPDSPMKVIAYSEGLYSFFNGMHYWVGYILIGFIGLHIIGAFKHHLIDRDGTLRRMFGGKI